MNFDSREYEYADVKVSLLGRELVGLRGLTYKTSQEKEPVYGAGNEPLAIQKGQKKREGNLFVLKNEYDLMSAAARLAGYPSLVDVPGHLINITCVYQKEGVATLSTDSLINVEFTEEEDGMKAGDKFKEISLPFLYLRHKKV